MTFELAGTCVDFRPLVAGDLNFVRATWLRSMRDLVPSLASPHFFGWQRPIVEATLERGHVIIACDAEFTGTIYGWVATRDGCPVYAYVVNALRHHGLGHALLEKVTP